MYIVLLLCRCAAGPQRKVANPHLLCEIGPVPLLQELSARVLRKALEGDD